MRIHHLNCISTCPLGGRLVGRGHLLERGEFVCHCVLVESGTRLVLIDTGLGLRDLTHPRERLSRFFLTLLRPAFRREMTAIRQIARMGFDPRDVRDIVLTNLEFDHAGGLDDFPHARVHLLERERAYADAQQTWLDRQRFRPQQWSTHARWHTYSTGVGQHWLGFDCVRDLEGLPPEILLVPLPGHTHGHTAVAVQGDQRWYLHAGDAYLHRCEMDPQPYCPPGLRAYQQMMELDHRGRVVNQERLRHLRREHGQEVEVFCAHDVDEFERLAGHPANATAEPLADLRLRAEAATETVPTWHPAPAYSEVDDRPAWW